MSNKLRLVRAVSLLCGCVGANATPVTLDFTGSGTLCAWPGVPTTYMPEPHCTNTVTKSFTGSVVLDVIGAGPFGSDSGSDGSTYAYDQRGWVESYFFIQWDGGSFSPHGFPGMTEIDSLAQVTNNSAGSDSIHVRESYRGTIDGTSYTSSAQMLRYTTDQTWLDDLSFDAFAGLAPNALFNFIDFTNYSIAWVEGGGEVWLGIGYEGRINLSSLSVRAPQVPVPEPGTLALFGLGIAAVGFARRRRAMN